MSLLAVKASLVQPWYSKEVPYGRLQIIHNHQTDQVMRKCHLKLPKEGRQSHLWEPKGTAASPTLPSDGYWSPGHHETAGEHSEMN